MGFFARLQVGLRRHSLRALAEAGLVFAAAWTGVDALDNAFPVLAVDTPLALFALVIACVLVGVVRSLPRRGISHRIGGTNSRLSVRFGDIFEESGLRVIPVNEFFDCELGEHVSPVTLHGQVIARLYGGDSTRFARDVDELLPRSAALSIPRTDGRTLSYPLGTTVKVKFNEERYLLVAFAKTDPATRKAHASVQDMWTALEGLWKAARIHSNGDAIVLPLLGSGQSGVGLPPQQLLTLILTAALAETKRQRIGGEIVVVIQEEFFEDVDLNALEALVR